MRLEMPPENKRSRKCFKFSLPYVKNVGTMVHMFEPLGTKDGESFTSSLPYLMCTKQRFSSSMEC